MLAEIVVPIGSPWSILCPVGILYLILCLIIAFSNKGLGWVCVLSISFIGACYVHLSTPNLFRSPANNKYSDYCPYVFYEGQWQNLQEMNVNNKVYPDYLTDSDQIKRYKMHIDGMSPFFWNPDCLYWSPLIACIVAIPVGIPILVIYYFLTKKG